MNLDTRIFYAVNHFARATQWLQPIVSGYAAYGAVLFALLMIAGWWSARSAGDARRMVAALWTPLGVVTAVAAIVMGFARVYVGAHYPQDVLAGFALGALVSLLGYTAARPALSWLLAWLARTPLRVLLS